MYKHFFIVSTLFFSLVTHAQNHRSWELVKEQKGIKVYTGEGDNTLLKRVKVTSVIDAPLSVVYDVLTDVKNHPKWMYQVYQAEILKKVNDTAWYYYAVSNSPWPVADRDYISFTKVVIDTVHCTIVVKSQGVPDYIPQKEGIVRLPYSRSKWTFRRVDDNQTAVELELEVDIGGKVPVWLVNLFISRGPYSTMLRFTKEVKENKNSGRFHFCL